MTLFGGFLRPSRPPTPVSSGRSRTYSWGDDQPRYPSAYYDNIPADQRIDFLADKPGHMTYGRRLALWLADRYVWYNPQLAMSDQEIPENSAEKPSLEKAWAFFEHVTLERYIVKQEAATQDGSSSQELHASEEESSRLHALSKDSREFITKRFHRGDRALSIAKPGESRLPTKLYPVLTTPLSQLGDFGLGYGLYFSTLRAYAILFLLAGIITIPNLVYFSSAEYSGGQPGVPTLLKGSAICTDQTWVPCPTCDPSQFEPSATDLYTTTRDVYVHGGAFHDEENGCWLNITDYLVFHDTDIDFNNEWRLHQDHGIVFHWEKDATVIEVEGYYNILLEEDTINCEINGPNQCFLRVGNDRGYVGDTSMGQRLGFAQKRNCEGATLQQGFVNYAAMIFVAIGALAIRFRQSHLEVAFDEDEQTARNYSIAILNPPGDAYEPDEWKAFFEDNFDCKVAVCTVDVDNDTIVRKLVKRRELQRKLELKIPTGSSVSAELKKESNNKASGGLMMTLFKKVKKKGPVQDLVDHIEAVSDKIRDEVKASKGHPTTKVFVTFETETAQRMVLSALTVGTRASDRNDIGCHSNPLYLFRGKHVLAVVEPEEPSTIRWQELNATKSGIYARLVLTSLVTGIVVLVALASFVEIYAFQRMYLASLVLAIFTFAFPKFAIVLMNLEVHHSETSRQKWLFIKIAVFDILSTTVLLSLITPFVAKLDKGGEDGEDGLIDTVHALFFAQLVFTPAFQLANIGGNIQRHLLAPRAKTQTEMNLSMMGSPMELAERYAKLIKYMFLVLWYCAIYPAAFFMGSLALFLAYFADRFSVMRTWTRSPQVGTEMSHFAQNIFTPFALVSMAVMSAYAWSGFPYDNLCQDNETQLHPHYWSNGGDWEIEMPPVEYKFFGKNIRTTGWGRWANFTITEGDQVYRFCKQDLRFDFGRSFLAMTGYQAQGLEWMTEEQQALVAVYRSTGLFVCAFVIFILLFRFITSSVVRMYQNPYSPRGRDRHIAFSSVEAIDSYIPQVHSNFFPYPLLLCDVKNIDRRLFTWRDPYQPHSAYDISKDLVDVVGNSRPSTLHVFSKVKHWLPSRKEIQNEGSSSLELAVWA